MIIYYIGGKREVSELLTTREVADYLKLDVSTITRWIREKKLPAIKVGRSYRIKREDITKITNEKEVKE